MRPRLRHALHAAACLLLAGTAPAWGALTPLGEPLPILDHPVCEERALDVALLPGGGFVAVWAEPQLPPLRGLRIMGRIFDAAGQPTGRSRSVAGADRAQLTEPEVAVDAAGRILIVWYQSFSGDSVRGRLFDRALEPLGEERALWTTSFRDGMDAAAPRDGGFALAVATGSAVTLLRLGETGEVVSSRQLPSSNDTPDGFVASPRLTRHGDSGLAAVWTASQGFFDALVIEANVLSSGDSPTFAVGSIPSAQRDDENPHSPVIASGASGTLLVAWRARVDASPSILFRLFDAQGALRGDVQSLAALEEPALSDPVVVADSAGGFLLLWPGLERDAFVLSAQRVTSQGEARDPRQRFATTVPGYFQQPLAAEIDAADRLTVAWGSALPEIILGHECGSRGTPATWRFDASPGPLTLQGGRFEVRATWTDHAGNSGEGRGVEVTGDSGSLWFFDPDNVEILVKVLDGRPINDHFWVFYASLSDVAYTLTVTDRVTGVTRTYENPAGQLASRADTSAFPETLGGSAGIRRETVAAAPPPVDSPAGPCTPPSLPVIARPGLCLDNRFEVEVAWSIPAAGAGAGQGVRLTRDSGYLWFFGPENIELVVKVLDGRPINGHFWVFYGALSDVEYTIVVRDTVTGATKTYHNPAGQLASRADVEAL